MQDAALVCLPLLALALFLYYLYRRTPAARWKTNLHAVVAAQEARLRHASRELVAITQDSEDKALRTELLGRQLGSVSVEELARYPNIGPVTVAKLRSAGLATVAACARVKLSSIPGIGPGRATDLTAAINTIALEAISRFDAGASTEGAAYKKATAARAADFAQRRQAADAALHNAEAGLATLRERSRIADGITFIRYLLRRQPAGLTAAVMNEPLVAGPVSTTTPSMPTPAATPPAPPVVQEAVAMTPKPPPKPVEVTPLERLRAVIAFGLAVAKADGRVAAAERKQVRAFVDRRYAVLTANLDSIIAEIEADVPTLGDALWQIKRVIPSNVWTELYQFAVSVADSAGERNTREIEFLARVAEELGVGVQPVVVPEPKPTVLAGPEPLSDVDCRRALEIAADTPMNIDLIRRQHRLLVERFDPEKFTIHGEDFVRLATQKRDLIERAARRLVAGYNEPLEPPAAPPPPADLRHNPDLDDVFGA
jgi:uncharacterized tellurite resistance protein B-like protein